MEKNLIKAFLKGFGVVSLIFAVIGGSGYLVERAIRVGLSPYYFVAAIFILGGIAFTITFYITQGDD